jgi:hypothetical protein
MGSKTTHSVIMLATIGFYVSVLGVGCADKKKSKSSEEQGANQDALYSATLVLPLNATAGTELTLTNDDISTVEITTFDKDGQELGTSSAAVNTDAEGVSTVDIMVDPTKITAVEVPGKDLGVVLQSTGVKPSEPIQRPMTPSGKNVVAAIKSIPAEQRPFVDPEVIGTLLPPEIKFDASTMKDMVVAFTEKSRELPKEKREELFLKRLEQKTDYKEIAKAKGSLENAQAAEAVVAQKTFIEKNPDLAQSSMVRFLEKPSEVIEKDESLGRKIPDAISEKVSGEALARQILARQVSVAKRALKPEEIIEMTDAMADVKAAVFIARRGADVGSKESMVSVIDTISKRIERTEKSEDIKSEVLFAVLMNVPELSESFEAKREEIAGTMCVKVLETLVNSRNIRECRQARDSCEIMNLRKIGWRSFGETKSDCFNPEGGIVPVQPKPQCEPELTKMFNQRTLECQISPDSCVEEKLILFGWRERISTDTCRSTEADQRICLMYVSHWKKDNGACKFALNSCEADDLEKDGFSRVDDPSTCQDSSEDYVDSSLPVNVPPPICAPVSAIMVNPVNNQCIRARHSCDEFKLAQEGFRRTRLSACPGSTLNQSSSTGSTTPR